MDDLIIGMFENANFFLLVSAFFCMCLFAWFLGFGIKLVMSILYNIKNVV